MKKVLLDSSVLFTAVNSPSGGSSKLFTLNETTLCATPLILTEVERNVRKKLTSHHLERFLILVEKLEIINSPTAMKNINEAKSVIAEKDAAILADFKNSDIHILATLDQQHFLKPEVVKFILPKKVLTPKMIIEMSEK